MSFGELKEVGIRRSRRMMGPVREAGISREVGEKFAHPLRGERRLVPWRGNNRRAGARAARPARCPGYRQDGARPAAQVCRKAQTVLPRPGPDPPGFIFSHLERDRRHAVIP